MSNPERDLLEELKQTLAAEFHQTCVEKYLETPASDILTKAALRQLQKVIDETDQS